jgi:16S rRNA processing protein RimM
LFKFRGIDSIDEAKKFSGWEVLVPSDASEEAPTGEYRHADLIGCEVRERGSEAVLGPVTALREHGGCVWLEVTAAGEPLLIPFAALICVKIDVAARRIEVELPEGLKELNQR